MSDHLSEVRRQILDENKRLWSNAEVDGGDADLFFTQIVAPLRHLKAEGVFDHLDEIKAAIDGRFVIIGVEIVGPINVERL
jgi:hypothetical protein